MLPKLPTLPTLSPAVLPTRLLLALTTPLIPDVPSTAEAGFPQFKGMWWGGLAAPAGTPQPIVDRLNKELNELVKSAEFLKLLDTLGYLPVGGPAQKLQERAEEEAQMWKEIAERAGVRVD